VFKSIFFNVFPEEKAIGRMALFPAAAARLFRVRRRQPQQQRGGVPAAVAGEAVVGPLPLLPRLDQAGFAENLHVIGKTGLADVELLQQHAGALFAAAQLLQHHKPVWIAEGLKDSRVLLILRFHDDRLTSKYFDVNNTKHIDVCQYEKNYRLREAVSQIFDFLLQ
jgi:hypothetical protein